MPLYVGAAAAIREQLLKLEKGERSRLIVIGEFTKLQFFEINRSRVALDLHELEQNQIVFIGRHLFASRSADGYSIDDIVDQLTSAMSESSIAHVQRMASFIQNPIARADRFGNWVNDRAVFEMSARKPRAELFSVIPKGDTKKPK